MEPIPGLARSGKGEPPVAFHDRRAVDGDDGVALCRLHHDMLTELRVRNPHVVIRPLSSYATDAFILASSFTDH